MGYSKIEGRGDRPEENIGDFSSYSITAPCMPHRMGFPRYDVNVSQPHPLSHSSTTNTLRYKAGICGWFLLE